MKSTQQKIALVSGLTDTKDVTPWENEFLKNIAAKCNAGQVTALSDKQREIIDRIFEKHFA
jgi:hypothetical protein